MKHRTLSTIIMAFACCCMACAQVLTVGTYNLRNRNDDDVRRGNGWEQRYPYALEQVAFVAPDIFGTQELFSSQIADIEAYLPNYKHIGVGRDDGATKGEHSAIFYNADALELLGHGDFWISETPDQPGMGWDAACPRICSWGKFRKAGTDFTFLFFSLHMDHVGVVARREGAKLVMQRMHELAQGLPAILTGDFNVDQTDEIYTIFTEGGLTDSYEAAERRFAPNGTFNDFHPEAFTTSRIDHVMLTPGFEVPAYAILTNTYWADGVQRAPSDHYPVFVKLSFNP